MAPRRGGGGGSSSNDGISLSSCPGAFQSDSYYSIYATPIAYFVSYCLFFVITLGILIAQCCIRKRKSTLGRRITGPVYIFSLLFTLLYYACIIIATVLRECGVGTYDSYYNWSIAYNIFSRLGTYLLLVMVVWSVNNTLREHLGNNSRQAFFKIIYAVILGFMFCLTAAYLGLQCYVQWTATDAGSDSYTVSLGFQLEKLSVSYWVFYLLSSLAAGALSITTLVSMRSRGIPAGDLLGWVIALTFCMFIWVIFILVEVGSSLQNKYLGAQTYEAFEYIIDFFQSFAFIVLLFIAKSMAWNNTSVDNTVPQTYNNPTYPPPQQQQPAYAPVGVPPPQQQQYAYNQQPNGQQYYYQQQPIYNGTVSEMNGQGGVAHAK